ncbi:MAG: thioredoxin [Clostridia bacterium]|nr:thioredoxin [Clostridia bacterium]
MSIIHGTKENFEEILNTEKTVLLDFFATWCGPCRMVGPILEEIAGEYPQYEIVKIDVDEQPELASRFGVMSIPTMVVMKNGEILSQSAGARPKAQILAMLQD